MSDTKKPGSSLDDLKARLGLDSVLKKSPESAPPPPAEAPASSPEVQPAAFPPDGRTPPPPGSAATPSVDMSPSGDYAAAVQSFEEPGFGEGEPDPVLSGSSMAVDPNLKAPVAASAKWAFVAAIVAGVGLSLAVGFGFGKVMRDRQVANQIIDESTDLLGAIEPIAQRLNDFQAALGELDNEYSEVLHGTFADYLQPSPPVLSSLTVSDSRVLMTTGEDLTGALLDYAVETEALANLVGAHAARTVADAARIQDLLEGAQAEAVNYGIYFDNIELGGAYNDFLESPEENPYIPPPARVVTYTSLDMTVTGAEDEEEDARYYFTVTLPNGTDGQVNVFDLLRLSSEQLIENTNEETALDRYRVRVLEIRARLATVIRLQEGLIQILEDRSSQSHTFAI